MGVEYLYYIFLGISPAIFCLWYFYRKDTWEPEPKGQVIKIFFLGIFAILPAGLVEYVVQSTIFNDIGYDDMMGLTIHALILNATICFLAIAPIEEFFKYSVVKVFMYYHKDFNEKVDGVIYMVAAAMGFAAFENVMYIFRAGFLYNDADPTYVGIMRGVLSTPAHAIFSGFLGVYLGRAKFSKNIFDGIRLVVTGFIIAIFIHGLYNSLIFAGKYCVLGVIPLLLIAGYLLMKNVQKLVNESPFKPKDAQQSAN